MTRISEEELRGMESRSDKATPKPWKLFARGKTVSVYIGKLVSPLAEIIKWPGFDGSCVSVSQQKKNARFITAARSDVPRLLKGLRAAYAREDAIRDIVNDQDRGFHLPTDVERIKSILDGEKP